jgi:DNA-binding transcriptional LysR family regulator
VDWTWLQSFLAVAARGSFSDAARALDISQPTVSRHIRALESSWGRPLFVRHNRGIELTDAGSDLLNRARGIEHSFAALLRHKDTSAEQPTGSVRVSVNEPIGHYVLPEWIGELRQTHPSIQLEMVVDNTSADLSRREADVAVRMYQPRQQQLVARKVADSTLGLYAHERYLEKYGEPRGVEDMARHTFAGLDRDPSWPPLLRDLGLDAQKFALRSDSLALHVQALLAGVSIATTHDCFAKRHPALKPVLADIVFPPLAVWVVMHEELRADPACSRVFRDLVRYLAGYFAAN